ncbi:glycosyltransferase [Robertmurraya sp. P23]|uniref:glycosyltransferase n=1 Tax=Robertmurraya sp. P23 TaxID=3436931 RepID=UPI003D976458
MKIMHYTLGLPPFRSGGLTRYAKDLMEEQAKNHEVLHLFPGKVDLINKKVRIKKSSKYNNGIKHFELVNSHPLPLFRGVKEPEHFIGQGPLHVFVDFLSGIRPDVLHVHTLMGIHQEFLIAAKEQGIRIVFTTHDYYGICPTINLYKDKENLNCNDFENGKGCQTCSSNSLSTKALLITQTSFYPALKKVKKYLPINGMKQSNKDNEHEVEVSGEGDSYKYVTLREYYLEMLGLVDYFHFNSSQTEEVYRTYLPYIAGEVLSITHKDIKKVKTKKVKGKKIRLGYLGPMKEYKGFMLLMNSFSNLPANKFELHLYGDESSGLNQNNVFLHGKYSGDELEKIFTELDVVIVPSIWRETFGFVTLEALSYGTPVIVSENVGSKDLVSEKFGWKFSVSERDELSDILLTLDVDDLYQKHLNINNEFKIPTIKLHSDLLIGKFYGNSKVEKS